jgi:hypothetical protein
MIKSLQIACSLVIVLLIHGLTMTAQVRQAEKQETLQQQKVKFFTENLQLTPAESSRFWPIYNDYQNRRDKITRDRNTLMKYFESNKNNLSENEAADLIRKYLAFQQEETQLTETYTQKFQEFLPAKKVMRIFIVELDFKKWLLENLRQNKDQAEPRK